MEPKTESDAGPCDEPFVVKTQQKKYAKARNEISIISLRLHSNLAMEVKTGEAICL